MLESRTIPQVSPGGRGLPALSYPEAGYSGPKVVNVSSVMDTADYYLASFSLKLKRGDD
jgi:hypothetical protein